MILLLGLYALVLTAMGLGRRQTGPEGFFFAGRRLGAPWVAATLTASWIGAASTLVTLQQAAVIGYAALWIMAVPTLLTLLVFLFLAGTIRRRRFFTLPDLLSRGFGPRVAAAAAALIFVYMILLTASQLVAWGQFLTGLTGIAYPVAVLGGALLVSAYSMTGGFLAVVRTDGMQLLFMSAAMAVLALLLGRAPRGSITSAASHFLQAAGDYGLLVLSFTLAWVISPVVWQRVAAARSTGAARRGILLSAAAVVLLYLAVIPVGMALRPLPGDTGAVLLRLRDLLPLWAGGMVFLGLASAILSTADTALNLAAMTVSQDFLPPRLRSSLRPARLGTLASAVLAVAVALRLPSILKTLGAASEIMAAGLFVPGMAALFLRHPGRWSGAFSLGLGGGFALLSSLNALGLPLNLPRWPASLPWGLAVGLLGFLLGCLLDRSRHGRRGATKPGRLTASSNAAPGG